MTPQGPEIEILLGLDGAFRRVPLASISASTRIPLPTLRESLSRLLLSFLDADNEAPAPPGREPPEGGDGRSASGPAPTDPLRNGTVPEEYKTEPYRPEPYGAEPADAHTREATSNAPVTSTPLTPEALAEALDDHAHLAFLRSLVETVDPAMVRAALEETLARRPQLRGRPGAYFAAIVRRLTNPHAHV